MFGQNYELPADKNKFQAAPAPMQDPGAGVAASTAQAGAGGMAAGGPPGAAIAAGSQLVTKIMEINAQREQMKIQQEMAKRQNLQNSLSSGYSNQATAMNQIVSNLAQAMR